MVVYVRCKEKENALPVFEGPRVRPDVEHLYSVALAMKVVCGGIVCLLRFCSDVVQVTCIQSSIFIIRTPERLLKFSPISCI